MLQGAWANLLKPMAVDQVIKADKKPAQASPSSAVGPKRMLSKCEREDLRAKAIQQKKMEKELKEKEKAEREAKKAEKESMPKKALSAYMIYGNENRARIKEANPEASQPDLSKSSPSQFAQALKDASLLRPVRVERGQAQAD